MTTTPQRKKLIEVSIPLEAINAAAAREKSIRHGHPSTLHLWWARRPLAACRAVLFSQLVDDPSSWPERFPTEEAQDAERRRLHRVIERMVPWEASNDESVLNDTRWEIARSVAWGLGEEPPANGDGKAILAYLQEKAPPIYDPFSGGGSIPLEAQRLGLLAYGSDLNPVAVLIGKALVEIPPKFAGRPPVNPKARMELERGHWNGRGAQGLAEDVRYYGQWIRDEAEKRIGHLYPKARLPDGSEATVIAWLWARTVRSPDPAANGAMVPLVSSFMLSTKDGKKAWVEPVIDASASDGWRFQVKKGTLSKAEEEKLKNGTKAGKGQAFVCALTGAAIDRAYVQAEGKADRLGRRLMAVVVDGNRSRIYLTPSHEHEVIARSANEWHIVEEARESFLSAATPTRAMITGGVCSAYGLRTYWHLFTPRQLVALTTFSDLIAEARQRVLAEAHASSLSDDPTPLQEGGTGAEAYADTVATYLGLSVSKLADSQNSLVSWKASMDQAIHLFTRQAIPMVWDHAEPNALGNGMGALTVTINNMMRVVESLVVAGPGHIGNINAAKNNYPVRPVVVSTDPPYYDNIGYADLSDFFYVWLRRALSGVWPDLFRRLAAPKAEELVATPYRFDDSNPPEWTRITPALFSAWPGMSAKERAEAFFMNGMGETLTAMRKAATHTEPLAIYYAFKQSEVAADGVTSAGWASFLQGIADAGLVVDGTWPVRTELSNRMISSGTNALASSIVLVCRKRNEDAPVITRAEFIRLLRRELPDAIDDIRKAGVGPVDMQQSVIGPGMGIFSRHTKVLEDDDSAMTVKTALAIINRVWEEIDQELDAVFDANTQVALTWFATYGFDTRSSGELITLANAKNIGTNALFDSGVFEDLRGKTALTTRENLPKVWSPAADKTLTIWECVQHTARVLNAEDGGAEAAGRLVAEMGTAGDQARKLAYRLFEIATQKGWSQEALVYNELAQEWPHLEDAGTRVAQPTTRPAQAAFDL
ncbi:DUF1156 domain-containing protein [Rhizobium sp. MC63]|uniref:DUF1156 domain-containing protein n=1 Tax=Rhizobium mulingense TaxID=3031128 RepID=A0ACC6MY59_9HYPH|nr:MULTISPECIES: DUF1156 domain-containing protein [unclassified Rhizobium]MDF0697486.1 DUF1156 domain-containing protein [Rhizobium sp. MC63]MEA3518334.1 DUF1156 domain-containing protein [Rhizobium sp. MJ31]